jgi:tRNA(Ile)-lysidine synthetase-like protein
LQDLNNITIKPGKYILGVSGGVDSVVLLDLLSKQKDVELIVAHVDHGIRDESFTDLEFVEELANYYGLEFESTRLQLGKDASEELARQKRYEYFKKLKHHNNAQAITTAHHQDDVIETAFINLVRGTGSRGLSSLKSNGEIIRPLITFTKKDILAYAEANSINWHEDKTNKDTKILRNKIRIDIIPKMSKEQKIQMLNIIDRAKEINSKLDQELNNLLYKGLHKGSPVVSRKWFNYLPYDISTEVVRKLLIDNGAKEIDKKTIERVVVGMKTLAAGKTIQANGVNITLTKRSARLKSYSKTDKKKL